MNETKTANLAENFHRSRRISIKKIAAIIIAVYLLIPLIRAAMSQIIITGVMVLIGVAGASLSFTLEGAIGLLAVAMLFLWRALPNFFAELSAVWWQHDPLACLWNIFGDGRVYVIFAAQILTLAALIIAHYGTPRAVSIAQMSDDEYNATVAALKNDYSIWCAGPLFLLLSIYVLVTSNGSLMLYIATPFMFIGGIALTIILAYTTYVLRTASKYHDKVC